MRLTIDKQNEYARELVSALAPKVGDQLANDILNAEQKTDAQIDEQRKRIAVLKEKLAGMQDDPQAAKALVPVQYR